MLREGNYRVDIRNRAPCQPQTCPLAKGSNRLLYISNTWVSNSLPTALSETANPLARSEKNH